jgi:hypothetical protein
MSILAKVSGAPVRSLSPILLLPGVLLVVCFIMSGCAVFFPETSAKIVSMLHAKPVVTALEKYRTEHLEYPQALASLYPMYLATNVPLTSRSWSIAYERQSPTHFQLTWVGGLSYAVYQTGIPVEYGCYVGIES